MVQSAEGTRAIALELCQEFEGKFLQHIATGEISGCHFFFIVLILSCSMHTTSVLLYYRFSSQATVSLLFSMYWKFLLVAW